MVLNNFTLPEWFLESQWLQETTFRNAFGHDYTTSACIAYRDIFKFLYAPFLLNGLNFRIGLDSKLRDVISHANSTVRYTGTPGLPCILQCNILKVGSWSMTSRINEVDGTATLPTLLSARISDGEAISDNNDFNARFIMRHLKDKGASYFVFGTADSTEVIGVHVLHKILCNIYLLIPDFNADLFTVVPATDELIAAYESGDLQTIFDAVSVWLQPALKDTESNKRKLEFMKVETQLINHRNSLYDNEIKRVNTNITSYETRLKAEYMSLMQLQKEKQFASTITQVLKEFIKYLSTAPQLKAIKAGSSASFTATIMTKCQNYDIDTLHKLRETDNNNLFRQNDFANWLFTKIFIDETYDLYFTQPIVFNLSQNSITANHDVYKRIGLPNPHLELFNCWGQTQPQIQKALMKGDFLDAWLFACAAVSNLNFLDGTVMSTFISILNGTENRYTSLADLPNAIYDKENDIFRSITSMRQQWRNLHTSKTSSEINEDEDEDEDEYEDEDELF